MNGVGSRTPFLTTRTLPPCWTTNSRFEPSPALTTWSGDDNPDTIGVSATDEAPVTPAGARVSTRTRDGQGAGEPARERAVMDLHRPMMAAGRTARNADHPAMTAAILSSMLTTDRRFGAQSMTAPLREVLVKRPGPAFGAAFDDPAHGFLHPVDLDVARREHDAFVELLGGLGPTVHVLDAEIASPDLVYTFDPLLVTDRGAIPLRPGKPNRRIEPAAHRGLDDRGRHPDGRADRGARHGRGRRHVLAAAGPAVHRPDAAHQRGRALGSWRPWSAATCGSSTCRTGAGRPS